MKSIRLLISRRRITTIMALGIFAFPMNSSWAVQTTTVLGSNGNNGYSIFDWTLSGPTGETYTTWQGQSSTSTQVTISGAFNVALSGVDFTASPPFWENQQTWSAFTNLKNVPVFGSFAVTGAPGNMSSYGSFSYQMTGTAGSPSGMNVIWTPVPEPSSALAGLLLGAGLLRRKRR